MSKINQLNARYDAERKSLKDIMDLLDDTVGDVVNAGFDLAKENLGGTFTNMTLLNMLLLSLLTDKPFPKASSTFSETYDYIIVGGGTAGSVMANRLSEKPCVSVLLLEAGGYVPLLTEIPSVTRLLYGSEIDWLYKTTPQKYGAFGQIENRVNWNSGKALGGSSIINAMLYIRGNKKNYDDWEKEGCTGWGYNDVLPYFIKLENTSRLPESHIDEGYHGKDGLMMMEEPNYIPEIQLPVIEELINLGNEVRDPNGERQTSVFATQGTLKNGQRCSTAKAYLVPAENRPNLTILKRAFARKILIENKAAYGVEFDFEGEGNTHTVYARKEVIISVGSVRTPQILMLSGIGPKDELEKHNITCIVDLPVGKNLHDHPTSYLMYKLDPTILNVVVKNLNPVNIVDYITQRKGPLASPDQVAVMAFMNGLNTTTTSPDFPRQQIYFAEYATIDALKSFNLKPDVMITTALKVFSKLYGPYALNPLYTCIVCLIQPESRGEILLNSTNPYDDPLINPNYYKKVRDVKDVVEGLKVCQTVAKSPAMQTVGSKPLETLFPGCEKYIANENKYLACYARSQIISMWHPVGTARMGRSDDPRSVVDPDLKVIGVSGLRVVNAAVMPIVPSGNTNVPTMMVAEKISDKMMAECKCES